MKRLFCSALASIMCISLAACAQSDDNSQLIYMVSESNSKKVIDIYYGVNNDNENHIQTIEYETLDTVNEFDNYYLEDITFDSPFDKSDKSKELILPAEFPASAIYFNAYRWNDISKKYELIESFRNIANPVIDQDEGVILSKRTASQITSYSKYVFKDGEFVCEASIYWEPAELMSNCAEENVGKIHFVEQRDGKKTELFVKTADNISVDTSDPQLKEYVAEDSYWDITNDKWDSCFAFRK